MGKYFGTDGVRGVANEQLTSKIAYRIGRFIGQYPNGKKNKILISRDTRISGEMFLSSLISGILASGGNVYDIGVSTTPSVSYLVNKKGFDYGIMISASHNPYYDNGIKLFNHNGEKISAVLEQGIEEYIDSDKDYLEYKINSEIGRNIPSSELIEEYLEFLCQRANDLSKLRILVDGANGSASYLSQKLFKRLNIKADYINVEPNGININDRCGSTHLEGLSKMLEKDNYDIGLAFDGDADRLLAVAPGGRIIDGDAIIYICASYLQKCGKLKDNAVVLTSMSNIGLIKALKDKGISIETTDVGDKYVQARLKEKNLVLGGEQSGHIMFLEHLNTGDGLLSAVQLLNIIASDGNVNELVSKFQVFPQLLKNVTVLNKTAILKHEGLQSLIREVGDELGDEGRILIRPSGTEPLVRVMCEAKTIEKCRQVVNTFVEFIESISY